MLALASLLFALSDPTKAAASAPPRVLCPSVPMAAYVGATRLCPALEISGRIDATGLTLDPAFEVMVPLAQMAHFERGDAALDGYSADGKPLFALPFAANGAFHLYVPLTLPYVQALHRLRLVTATASVERTARPHAEPVAEAVTVDDNHFIIAWDASVFPALRIGASPSAPPFAYATGSSTYQQLTVAGNARRISVDFSDGVRSVRRTVPIFGRQ